MTEDPKGTPENMTEDGKRAWHDEIEIAGRDAMGRVQDLIEEGNVRRLIILTEEDRVLLEVPLTVGVGVGVGALALAAPLAAIGAVVALFAKIKIRVVRVEE